MTGVATTGCSIGIFALVLAGCSGRVVTREDGGLSSGGGTSMNHDPPGVPGSGGTSGTAGGKGAGGATRGTGGVPSFGGANSGRAGGASSGGTVGAGGLNTGGGAGDCSYDPLPPGSPSAFPLSARVDLPTICGLREPFMCKFSAAQLLEGYDCSPDAGAAPGGPEYYKFLFHDVGCGNETVGWNGGYGGPSETFSLGTGQLVGATLSSDTNFGPCNTFSYRAGQTLLECPGAVKSVCVPSSSGADAGGEAACTDGDIKLLLDLPSRPECDCSRPSGIDPCFGAGSCECWCSLFVPAARACAGTRW